MSVMSTQGLLSCMHRTSPIHLPLIMPPDAPYRLLHGVRPAVLVVRMGSLVLMEYNHRPLLWILRIMQIPVMTGIPGHDRHIISICGDDGETLRIQALQVFITEHRQPPSRQTTHPEPVLQEKPSAQRSCPQNTYCKSTSAV